MDPNSLKSAVLSKQPTHRSLSYQRKLLAVSPGSTRERRHAVPEINSSAVNCFVFLFYLILLE